MRTPGQRPGARGRHALLLDGNVCESTPRPLELQVIPATEAETLAYGEALPTGAQLAQTRALWWLQRCQATLRAGRAS